MTTIILLIHGLIAVALITTILLQRSEGGALGIGGGGGFMTGRGTANVLTRTTTILALGFFVTSIALTLLARHGASNGSLVGKTANPPGTSAPASPQGGTGSAGGSNLPKLEPLLPAQGGGTGNSP